MSLRSWRARARGFLGARPWMALDPLLQIVPLLLRRPPRSDLATPANAFRARRTQLARQWFRALPWYDQVAFSVSWPVVLPAALAVVTRANGRECRNRTGIGLCRQIGQQLRICATRGVPPPWYYVFELFEAEHRARAGDYLLRAEANRLIVPELRRAAGSTRDASISDKALFAEECSARGVRAVRTLAVARRGELEWLSAPGELLSGPGLFVKALRARGGSKGEAWRREDDAFVSNRGVRANPAELLAHLERTASARPLIVQERLENHPAMQGLSAGALATIRLVSCLDESGEPESIAAALRMPMRADSAVDNFHAGGCAAGIELSSGRLGQATDLGLWGSCGWLDAHPTTRARIAGAQLPAWPEVLELAALAHRSFPQFVLVGWDIAILADGPCMIEGNHNPGLDLIQRVTRTAQGCGRLAELLDLHLARAGAGDA